MIFRILSEGQYRLESVHFDSLNEIDDRLVAAVAAEDEESFQGLLKEMLAYVREKGQPLPPEDLSPSDVVLPAADITLEEARQVFTGAGVLPG